MDTHPAPRTTSRSAFLVPLLCWLALAADGYDLFAYGATIPGLLAEPGWAVTPASAGPSPASAWSACSAAPWSPGR